MERTLDCFCFKKPIHLSNISRKWNSIFYLFYICFSFETIKYDLPYFSCELKFEFLGKKGFPSVFLVQFCNPLFLPQTSFKRCYHELKHFVCYRVFKFNFHFFIKPYKAKFYTGNTKQARHHISCNIEILDFFVTIWLILSFY